MSDKSVLDILHDSEPAFAELLKHSLVSQDQFQSYSQAITRADQIHRQLGDLSSVKEVCDATKELEESRDVIAKFVVTLVGLKRTLEEQRPSNEWHFSGFSKCFKTRTVTRNLDLLGYALPRKLRTRVYEPTCEELKEEYALCRRKYRTKWARRWLSCCFGFRTLLLIAGCYRALVTDTALQVLLKLVPEPIKRWWLS